MLAVLAFVAYGSGLGIGFVSDDHYWLLSGVREGWRHAFDLVPHSSALPFELLLHSAKYGLFGFNAVGFHLLDLGAHIVVCFLVYLVARGVGLPSAAAGAAALLGAVAPAPSQAVYWTSADEHVMATLGALGSLALYFAYRTNGRRLFLAGAILLAVIAALTKFEGTAVVFGVLAYELVWRRRHRPYLSPSGRGQADHLPSPSGGGQADHIPSPSGEGQADHIPSPSGEGQADHFPSPSGGGQANHFPSPSGGGQGGGLFALRVAPFALAAGLFYGWELSATDRLRSAAQLGPHMIGRAGEVLRAIVLPYNPSDLLAPAHTNRALAWLAALAALGVAALLLVCIVAAFARFSVIGLGLLWVGPQLPTLSLTDRLQARYTYLPAMVTFLLVASGAVVLLEWLVARKVPVTAARALAAVALIGLLAVSIRATAQSSTTLKVTERESSAFSSAVLRDHPVLAPHTTIFLIGSPLDVGSATWVFADPRLGPQVFDNIPAIEHAASLQAIALHQSASPILVYERDATGVYVERSPIDPLHSGGG